MNTRLDISFFKPNMPEISYKGKLYLDTDGKNYIEIFDNLNENLFEGIDVLFATDVHAGEKYTLVNCAFSFSNFRMFRYLINEIYKGAHLDKVINESCLSVKARMTYLTRWINHPRFRPQFSSSIHEPGSIMIKEEFVATIEITENLTMELHEFCACEQDWIRTFVFSLLRFSSGQIYDVSQIEFKKGN